MPSNATPARGGDRQGLLLETEVLINEEFTGTFAIVRANYTPTARPAARSPRAMRASFNPREGKACCANRSDRASVSGFRVCVSRGVRSRIEQFTVADREVEIARVQAKWTCRIAKPIMEYLSPALPQCKCIFQLANNGKTQEVTNLCIRSDKREKWHVLLKRI